MLENLVMTKTEAEKLYEVFRKKFFLRLNYPDSEEWVEYLDAMEGVTHIRKFSDYSDPVEHLLEAINESPGERFVIRDPMVRDYFILIEKELAQKILVLGSLP